MLPPAFPSGIPGRRGEGVQQVPRHPEPRLQQHLQLGHVPRGGKLALAQAQPQQPPGILFDGVAPATGRRGQPQPARRHGARRRAQEKRLGNDLN